MTDVLKIALLVCLYFIPLLIAIVDPIRRIK